MKLLSIILLSGTVLTTSLFCTEEKEIAKATYTQGPIESILPTEIQMEILSFLPLTEIVNCDESSIFVDKNNIKGVNYSKLKENIANERLPKLIKDNRINSIEEAELLSLEATKEFFDEIVKENIKIGSKLYFCRYETKKTMIDDVLIDFGDMFQNWRTKKSFFIKDHEKLLSDAKKSENIKQQDIIQLIKLNTKILPLFYAYSNFAIEYARIKNKPNNMKIYQEGLQIVDKAEDFQSFMANVMDYKFKGVIPFKFIIGWFHNRLENTFSTLRGHDLLIEIFKDGEDIMLKSALKIVN